MFSGIRLTWLLWAFSFMLLLMACQKEPGRGGLASIRGKVFSYDATTLGAIVDSGYLAGVRVYIAYGDHNWVDDDVRTGINGEYSFDWLRKGTYKIWVVNDCATCPGLQAIDSLKVEVGNKRETYTVRDLIHVF